MRLFFSQILLVVCSVSAFATQSGQSGQSGLNSAVNPGILVFEMNGKNQEFIQNKELNLILSKKCQVNSQVSSQVKSHGYECQAYQVLKKVSLKKVQSERGNGRNPGTLICRLLPGAQVQVGFDVQGNENSFCAFPDGSVVDSGTLVFYGIQNDKQNDKLTR